MVAVYLGEIDENKILDMSHLFFQDVVREIGYKLNYEAVVNYAGNAFCEKSWEMISENNPFQVEEKKVKTKANNEIVNLFASMPVKVVSGESSPEYSNIETIFGNYEG